MLIWGRELRGRRAVVYSFGLRMSREGCVQPEEREDESLCASEGTNKTRGSDPTVL